MIFLPGPVWKRIQDLGLIARYRDAAFTNEIRMFLALAFTPHSEKCQPKSTSYILARHSLLTLIAESKPFDVYNPN